MLFSRRSVMTRLDYGPIVNKGILKLGGGTGVEVVSAVASQQEASGFSVPAFLCGDLYVLPVRVWIFSSHSLKT